MFEQDYIRFSLNESHFSLKAFPPKGPVDLPVKEAEKSAFYFYKKYKSKRLVLCLSGGLDSEVMAESFLRAGIPFSASIWRYKNNMNDYDIKTAIKFCEKHKVDYEIEEGDLELFYKNKLHIYYGKKYLCNSPQVAVHLYFLEKLLKKPHCALFLPWQAPVVYYNPWLKKTLVKLIIFRYLSYYRFFYLNKTEGCFYFLMCRSALLYSFLKLPITRRIMRENKIFPCDYYKIKSIMYSQGGFAAQPKKGKFTGFDKLKSVLMAKYGIDYNKAFRRPLMRMMPDPRREDFYVFPIWEE